MTDALLTSTSLDSTRGRLLGLDHGTKVIGVAVCDSAQFLAHPLKLITRTNRERDFATINALISEQSAIGVVLGLPEMPPDFAGVSQEHTVQHWAVRLAGQISIPVYLWEETFSSVEARRTLNEAGFKRRERIDDVAATLILQAFLDAHPAGTPYPIAVKARRHKQL